MPELLHGWALAPAVIGTCCLVADRGRARAPELAASVLMLLAMLDASGAVPVLPPIAWAALLLGAAMVLAAVRRTRVPERASMSVGDGRAMQLLTTTGVILMACLLLLGMPHGGSAGGHAHGGVSGSALTVGVSVASGVYVLVSALWAVRARQWRDRAQIAAMGLSALLMSVAALS